MSLNTGFFASFNQRHKRTTLVQRVPISQQTSHSKSPRSSSVDSTAAKESFLPLITSANGNNEGHRPYRRNDFANNHVFVAKHRLARLFLDQSTPTKLQAKSDLIHLFDQHQPKQKTRKVNYHKRQVTIILKCKTNNEVCAF